jgi:hypothetical protein
VDELRVDLRFGTTGPRNWRERWFWRPSASYGVVPFDGVRIRQLGVRLPFVWFSLWLSKARHGSPSF